MYIRTIELLGSITNVQTSYDVAGIPSMLHPAYMLVVNGKTYSVYGAMDKPPYMVGDEVLMKCDVYAYERQQNRVHPSDIEEWSGKLLRYTESWCDLVITNYRVE